MKYSLLIFDLDNTIFDYDRAEKQALDLTLKGFGIEPDGGLLESYREINEKNWRRMERKEITSEQLRVYRFDEFGRVHGFSWVPEEVSSVYLRNLGLGGFIVSGAGELLTELRKSFRLAAVTNGIADVQRSRISNSVLEGFFDPLIISDEVGVAKPDPGIFQILFERAGITDKSTALMIGDGLSSDIAGALSFGIDCCWYNPYGAPEDPDIRADYIVRDLKEIRDLVN